MDKAIEALKAELEIYSKDPLNGVSFLTTYKDQLQTVYAVVDVSKQRGRRYVDVSLLVRLKGNCIIIEHDVSNKMLVDALLQRGVPRDRIVLAYAGESAEEAA
jgi:hypothetical protein